MQTNQKVEDSGSGAQKTIEIKYNTAFEAQRVKSSISGANPSGLITSQQAVTSRGLELTKIRPQGRQRSDADGQNRSNESFGAEQNDWSCTLDGVMVPCSMANRAIRSGGAMPSFLERYQKFEGFRFDEVGLGIYRWEFYVPGNNENKPLPPPNQITNGHWERGTFMFRWERSWRTGSWQSRQTQTQDEPKYNKGDEEAIAKAKLALAEDSPCAKLFDEKLMGMTAQQFLEKVIADKKLFFVNTLNEGFRVAAGYTYGKAPSTSTSIRVKEVMDSKGNVIERTSETIVQKIPGRFDKIVAARKAPFWMDLLSGGLSLSATTSSFRAYYLIHELGHAADLLYGENASKIIRDRGLTDAETNKLQSENNKAMEECKKYIKSLK